MRVEELRDALEDCAADDEVVVVGKYGQLWTTRDTAHCGPVLSVDEEDYADVRGRLFVYVGGVRKYPVMTDEEIRGTGRYGP